jgi:hypothetical protein
MAMREMRTVSLDALDYDVLLAELRPERAPAAAVPWHGRLELEASCLRSSSRSWRLPLWRICVLGAPNLPECSSG